MNLHTQVHTQVHACAHLYTRAHTCTHRCAHRHVHAQHTYTHAHTTTGLWSYCANPVSAMCLWIGYLTSLCLSIPISEMVHGRTVQLLGPLGRGAR